MNTGHLNSDLIPEEQKRRTAAMLGAALHRMMGLDPSRYSETYLAGTALAAANLFGRYFSLGHSTMDLAETPEDQHALHTFEEATRGA
jgi:hypothetical protein